MIATKPFLHRWARMLLGLGIGVVAGVASAWPAGWHATNPPSVLKVDAPNETQSALTPEVKLYDADPIHLWNRIHSALFLRIARDGTRFGEDGLDPLLWPRSQFLLLGECHKYVVSVLDEFLAKEGHKLIKDPIKKVLFQRDLWSVFDWLSNPNATYQYRAGRGHPRGASAPNSFGYDDTARSVDRKGNQQPPR